jgi:hypothetical protein
MVTTFPALKSASLAGRRRKENGKNNSFESLS